MRKSKHLFFLLLMLSFSSGCSAQEDHSRTAAQADDAPQNFTTHFASAREFWDLRRKGAELRKAGRYEEALNYFKKALKDYAYLKPEQAVALNHIAMTYEDMKDYVNAAKFYELASETTMSHEQKIQFSEKAQELRQKADPPSL